MNKYEKRIKQKQEYRKNKNERTYRYGAESK